MSDTIAAISTPQNTGGIGIIRISGDNAIEIAEKVSRKEIDAAQHEKLMEQFIDELGEGV